MVVIAPWPISIWAIRMVMVLSGEITTQLFTSVLSGVEDAATKGQNRKPTASPPARIPAEATNDLRSNIYRFFTASLLDHKHPQLAYEKLTESEQKAVEYHHERTIAPEYQLVFKAEIGPGRYC
jgi:hypothetical protein